jgi:hypothetical protein
MAEARRLWDLEKDKKGKLTTIQAGIVLNVACNTSGMDKIGYSYLVQAVALSRDMRLYHMAASSSIVNYRKQKMNAARAWTAWSLFSWQA